jgi:hypothetical protein
MKNPVTPYQNHKFENMRAAKERKRLASQPSEMDEELRWLHNNPRKTNPKVQQVLMRA